MVLAALPPTLSEILNSAAESLFPAQEFVENLSVDSKNSEGDTPLHVMAWRGDVASSKVLIASGANINALGDMNETALHVAIRTQNSELVLVLLAAGAKTNVCSEFGYSAQEMAQQAGGSIASLFKNRASRRRIGRST